MNEPKLGDPADKGVDQFVNRRAGYGHKLEMIRHFAKKGGSLHAGEGETLMDHYEAAIREALELMSEDTPHEKAAKAALEAALFHES